MHFYYDLCRPIVAYRLYDQSYTSLRPQISVTATFVLANGRRWSLVVGDHFGRRWSATGRTLCVTDLEVANVAKLFTRA